MDALKKRILYVEGNRDNREVINLLLKLAGFEVIPAETIAEGLALARAGDLDLCLLDGKFKDGTGAELCQRIREFDQQTPIIFFSGLAYEADRERGLSAGAQAYLTKPHGIDILVETISGWVEAGHSVKESVQTL